MDSGRAKRYSKCLLYTYSTYRGVIGIGSGLYGKSCMSGTGSTWHLHLHLLAISLISLASPSCQYSGSRLGRVLRLQVRRHGVADRTGHDAVQSRLWLESGTNGRWLLIRSSANVRCRVQVGPDPFITVPEVNYRGWTAPRRHNLPCHSSCYWALPGIVPV